MVTEMAAGVKEGERLGQFPLIHSTEPPALGHATRTRSGPGGSLKHQAKTQPLPVICTYVFVFTTLRKADSLCPLYRHLK